MTAFPLLVEGTGLAYSRSGPESLAADREPGVSGSAPPDASSLAELLPNVPLRRIPQYARTALLAALSALRSAAWPQTDISRAALVLGTAYGGVRMSMDFMDSILDNGPQLSSPTAFSHAVNNVGAGLLSLLLGIRGPCCTLSQFGLSFAGALTAAETLLASGRVEHVLAGAVDELDERFSRCCPQQHVPGLVPAQGAVFFCLTSRPSAAASLRVLWDQEPAEDHEVLLCGGGDAAVAAVEGRWWDDGPLAHPLDVLAALERAGAGGVPVDCLCRTPDGRQALVEVRRVS